MVHETVRFIEEHRNEPFYINLWANLPHTLLNPTPDQLAVYSNLTVNANDFINAPGYRFYLNQADDLLLFNIVEDPTESTDLASNPAHSGIVNNLRAQVMAWKTTLPGPR